MATTTKSNLGIDPDVLKQIYGQISRIHAVDQAILKGISAGRFQFSYWPMTGQEAIPAVLSTLVDTTDYMVTIYRGIHDQVAKGVPLRGLFAEALARENGLNKGKGGSPHISDPASGSMLTTAIVGGGAPIANGLALAAQLRNEKRVTVVNFGDGATSIGAVHEAMNLAGAWKLPVIFMCQNNQIGEYTKIRDYTASPDFAGRADALGFRGVKLDGNDPIAFYNAMQKIVADVRAGKGPVFVEAVTLRLGAHSGPGQHPQITKEELEVGRRDWPVPKTRHLLIEAGILSEDEIAAIDAAAEAEVADAIEFALASAPSRMDNVLEDVFENCDDVPRKGHHPVRAEEGPVIGETRSMDIREAILTAQDHALTTDPGVFLLGEDIGDPPGGVFKTSNGLQTKWGDRVRPTPIAETAIIGAATGAALVGMRPIAEIMFCDFIGVAMDQIANHMAKQRYMSGSATNVPATIRIICSGGIGGFGAQHSQSLEAWLLHTPGLKVVYPSSALEARGLLSSCIFDDDPCVHLEAMALMFSAPKQDVPLGDYRIPLGVAKVKREGTDISLITFGWQVPHCLNAAQELAKEGINAEVIDLRSLMPLDYHRVLDSVKKTRRALVVHAATEFCGLGSEIAQTINEELFSTLIAPAHRLGAVYAPISYSREVELQQTPNHNSIVARVHEIMAD